MKAPTSIRYLPYVVGSFGPLPHSYHEATTRSMVVRAKIIGGDRSNITCDTFFLFHPKNIGAVHPR